MQLEQQIYSIEAANINHETLAAMKQAGAAMETIHNGMKLEDVDKTMYVLFFFALVSRCDFTLQTY
jgi:charged multivesicular body protein 4